MKRITTTVVAILIGAVSSGCTWEQVASAISLLDGGRLIIVDDRGDCDEWYDFADPDC